MAWEDETLEIIRVISDDLAEPYRNDDTSLRRVLAVAAFQVMRESDFNSDYSVDVMAGTVTPDPTDPDARDDAFINLATLKAACILDRGGAAEAARKGFAVRAGGTSYDNRAGIGGRLELLKLSWCKEYETAKFEHESGQDRVPGAAVLTPFRLYAQGRRHIERGR